MASGPSELAAERPLLRRAFVPLTAFVGVIAAAVGGYMVLGGVGVVEAAFWLVDPTSIELHFREHSGPEQLTKAYAVAVTVGLVLTGVWIGETVVATAFGGQIQEEFKHMQQERKIAGFDGHVVVCGYGMFGQTIAERLDADSRDIVVIEVSEAEARQAEREGYLVVEGDARAEAVLKRAGVERAGTLVAAIDDSNVNIQIAITANKFAPETRLVVRVGDKMYETLARHAGADVVVIPEILSGEDIAGVL